MANNSSGGGGGMVVFVIIFIVVALISGAMGCGSSKSSHTPTAKEKQTAQYMGEHGYFDYGKKNK